MHFLRNAVCLAVWCQWVGAMDTPIQPPVVIGQQVVELPAGRFQGDRLQIGDIANGPTYLRLRGIQYAEHPVGDLRWQPPQPVGVSSELIDARSFGNDCVQAPWKKRYASIHFDKMGEDCLFLNVWAWEPSNGTTLPVMFWMHGGSFTQGGTSRYNGDNFLALRRDVVLVSTNYRLGALGFLAGTAVQRSTRDGSAGNFALQDTREALRWVQRNIAGLHGDPARVTIMGESSGASFVACHMIMPRSDKLFSGAIMESGAFDNYTVQAVAATDDNFHQFATHAGCGTGGNDTEMLECLRRRPLRKFFGNDLMNAIAITSLAALWGPTVDGVELTDTPEVLAAKGQVNEMEGVILGTNLNEGRFMMMYTNPVPGAPNSNEQQFREWLNLLLANDTARVDTVFSLYAPLGRTSSWWEAASKAYTDQQYTCPNARSAHWLARSGKVPRDNVFVYELHYESQDYAKRMKYQYWKEWCLWKKWNCPEDQTRANVGHGADVGLLFPPELPMNKTDQMVAEIVGHYWENFASSRNTTSASSSFVWPPFPHNNTTMFLDIEPSLSNGNRVDYCKVWDSWHSVPYSNSIATPLVV